LVYPVGSFEFWLNLVYIYILVVLDVKKVKMPNSSAPAHSIHKKKIFFGHD
jgi:hypothetical protein